MYFVYMCLRVAYIVTRLLFKSQAFKSWYIDFDLSTSTEAKSDGAVELSL